MRIHEQRKNCLARFRSRHPVLRELEWHVFKRAFPVELLYNITRSPHRNRKSVTENQLIAEYCVAFALPTNWSTYYQNMRYWLQLEKHDPRFFEKNPTLDHLVGATPSYITRWPLVEEPPRLDCVATPTRVGLFTCPRCKSKNTEHTSLQTRRADEGLTNFIFCWDCQHRWRR
jgi:DNA-directed RNA polymerase subunit M/transcription elongation factor TFIIS